MSTLSVAPNKGSALAALNQQTSTLLPSLGASFDANEIADQINDMAAKQLGVSVGRQPSVTGRASIAGPIEERLYNSLARAKIMTSKVAMHLEDEARRKLFAHLDRLLNVDAWYEDDTPLVASSFSTFLRFLVFVKPERQPALGISDNGDLMAGWTAGADKLQIECLTNDTIRWIVNCSVNGEHERAVGDSFVARMPAVLAPYFPDRWFKIG